MPTMLFLRDFHGLSGGHLKYRDYLRHTLARGCVDARLFLTPGSLCSPANPFLSVGVRIVEQVEPADSYFIAGLDWELLDAAGVDTHGRPVVNLIQHVSHAHPGDRKYAFLTRPALRICVSAAVADAIRATGEVEGEIVTIENGVDLDALVAVPRAPARAGVFISGYKNPQLAHALKQRLESALPVDLPEEFLPREDYLARIASARLAVLLPHAEEGFYLPALEAMALETPVIVPDCSGNRGFCKPGESCLMPDYDLDSLVQAVTALNQDENLLAALAARGLAMAAKHSLARERDLYLAALADYLPKGFV